MWVRVPGPQKYVKIMAFMAIICGLGPLFYILLGFRESTRHNNQFRHLMYEHKGLCRRGCMFRRR